MVAATGDRLQVGTPDLRRGRMIELVLVLIVITGALCVFAWLTG